HVFERKINPVALVITGDVLPKIRKLERRTGKVRKPEALFIAITAHIQHKLPYRVRRVVAILEYVAHSLHAHGALVASKRHKQVCEWFLGNVAGADRLRQRYEDRMPRLPEI